MDICFKELCISDKAFVDEILQKSDKRFCEYTFGNMYCWGKSYGMQIAIFEDGFIVGNPDKKSFNFPAGKDIDRMIKWLISKYDSFSLSCLSENEKEWLSKRFDGFEISEMPKRFDYIYESEKLQSLTGKKLAAKRNHINAFLSDGNYYTEYITGENIQSVYEFNKNWCKGICTEDESLAAEMCALEKGLKNFDELGYHGLILYKNGKLCAYSFGEPINSDTFCVHAEKADTEVRGAYQMINREFAREFCKDFMYINREDDAGDEGLRRAKMSYYPTDIGKKYRAVYKK